jgi:hypothetical protein
MTASSTTIATTTDSWVFVAIVVFILLGLVGTALKILRN